MNLLGSVNSHAHKLVVLLENISNLSLNPQTALNYLSWTINSPVISQTLSITPSDGLTIPSLTNTSTTAIVNGLVNNTLYTFTISYDTGTAVKTASLTATWTSNTTHFYKFETADVSNNTIKNYANGTYDLTPINNAGSTAIATDFKKIGTGSYKCTGNYANITPFTADVRQGFAISMWFYQISGVKMFNIRFTSSTDSSILWCRLHNGKAYAYYNTNNGILVTDYTFPLNTWTHFTLSCSSAGVMTAYVNGVLDKTTPGYALNSAVEQTAIAQIGGYAYDHGTVNARQDNVYIFNKPVSAVEAAYLYAQDTLVTDGLALYYDVANPACYNSSTPTVVNDLSGNNRTGAMVGVTVADGVVVVNVVPEVTQYINTNYNPVEFTTHTTTNPTSYTFELWFFDDSFGTTGGGSNTTLIGNLISSSSVDFTIMHISNTGEVLVAEQSEGTGTAVQVTSSAMTTNAWHHIVKTTNATTQAIYIDGVLEGEVGRATGSLVDEANRYLRIGGGWEPRGQTCKVGPMRIYMNKALTLNEIVNNYNYERTRFTNP